MFYKEKFKAALPVLAIPRLFQILTAKSKSFHVLIVETDYRRSTMFGLRLYLLFSQSSVIKMSFCALPKQPTHDIKGRVKFRFLPTF
jgi:hypothetical protein